MSNPVILGELLFGARKSDSPQSERQKVIEYIELCVVVTIDTSISDFYRTIKLDLQQRGLMIPENDIWIAATARQYDLTLVTADLHFQRIESLRTVIL